jgi:hypothetical protein
MSDAGDSGKGQAFAEAARSKRSSLTAEFLYYLRRYKRWSMLPILIALALLGALVSLGGTGAAPFIYALF